MCKKYKKARQECKSKNAVKKVVHDVAVLYPVWARDFIFMLTELSSLGVILTAIFFGDPLVAFEL